MTKKLGSSSSCEDVLEVVSSLPGNLVNEVKISTTLITGANAGIGKANARALAKLGGHIILASRTLEKTEKAIAEIQKDTETSSNLIPMKVDLTKLSTVKAFVDDLVQRIVSHQIPPLRVLILNAGMVPEKHELSSDGINFAFQANHLGHFYMIRELLKNDPNMIFLNGECRIVVVSSNAHKMFLATKKVTNKTELLHKVVGISQPGLKPYISGGFSMYGNTKLANVLFAQSLNELPDSVKHGAKITAVAIHPGIVLTEILDKFSWVGLFQSIMTWFSKNVDQGASTQLYAALAPDATVKGKYFSDCKVDSISKLAQGETGELARKLLWDISDEILDKIVSGQLLN